MNKIELLNYAILGIGTGVFGYVLYLYVIVPHICSTTLYTQILNQCKVFDTNTRLKYAIPFIITEIILILILIKLKRNNRYTSADRRLSK